MSWAAQVTGEIIYITMKAPPVITLKAVGTLWSGGGSGSVGQNLDIDFILDQSTLG